VKNVGGWVVEEEGEWEDLKLGEKEREGRRRRREGREGGGFERMERGKGKKNKREGGSVGRVRRKKEEKKILYYLVGFSFYYHFICFLFVCFFF
jgi:hypothetical protein